jgi:hypothetical protein
MEAAAIAISTEDHKQAALFFDAVLPLNSADAVPTSIRYEEPPLVAERLNAMDVTELARFAQLYRMLLKGKEHPSQEALDVWFSHQREYAFTTEDFAEFTNMMTFLHQQELAKAGIPSVPLFGSRGSYQGG